MSVLAGLWLYIACVVELVEPNRTGRRLLSPCLEDDTSFANVDTAVYRNRLWVRPVFFFCVWECTPLGKDWLPAVVG